MEQTKAAGAAPKASADQASEASTLPQRPKPVLAEDLGLKTEEAKFEDDQKVEAFKPKGGWVKDRDDRFHEVEDVASYLAAYPGSKEAKKSEVVKARVGYARGEGDAAEQAQG